MTWPEVVAFGIWMAGVVGMVWAATRLQAGRQRTTEGILRGLRKPTWRVGDSLDDDWRVGDAGEDDD